MREEYESLVRGTYRAVVRWVYAWTNDWHEAEDVVQEACLVLWRRRERVAYWKPALLYRAARHRMLDVWRTRPPRMIDLSLLLSVGAEDERLEQTLDRLLVDDLLSLLTENQRAVLALQAEGYDQVTIGQMLGIPAGTVRTRAHQARSQLRKRATA